MRLTRKTSVLKASQKTRLISFSQQDSHPRMTNLRRLRSSADRFQLCPSRCNPICRSEFVGIPPGRIEPAHGLYEAARQTP